MSASELIRTATHRHCCFGRPTNDIDEVLNCRYENVSKRGVAEFVGPVGGQTDVGWKDNLHFLWPSGQTLVVCFDRRSRLRRASQCNTSISTLTPNPQPSPHPLVSYCPRRLCPLTNSSSPLTSSNFERVTNRFGGDYKKERPPAESKCQWWTYLQTHANVWQPLAPIPCMPFLQIASYSRCTEVDYENVELIPESGSTSAMTVQVASLLRVAVREDGPIGVGHTPKQPLSSSHLSPIRMLRILKKRNKRL